MAPLPIGYHFQIKTDHQSLKFLLEQRILTQAQQKWLSKLAGYDFEILYKKGHENICADALSRRITSNLLQFNAIMQLESTELMAQIAESWQTDSPLAKIITQLKQGNPVSKPYVWSNNKLSWKGRLVVGCNADLRKNIIRSIHTGSSGGHSGYIPILHKLKSIFHWRGMGKATKRILQECEVCQINKYEHVATPGLLQPLPIPDKVWTHVSLDFIDGLPKSSGKDTILVVVDKLSKYAHFIAIAHPYSAITIAQAYLDHVYKLHGMPEILISDRDAVFLSKFWQELLKLLKIQQNMSTAYHPQTDGQTEVVNRCLETYLRCMTGEKPREWAKWLSLAEWWYNTNYHSSTQRTPYEVMYGKKPPLHIPYVAGSTVVEAVDRSLQTREEMVRVLKQHLQAINRMKMQADKHRKERELFVGDYVYVKLHPYKQSSVTRRSSYKLAPRYFGPFEVLSKIGAVAYKLKLPPYAKIHPVFHVSILKKKIGNQQVAEILPQEATQLGQVQAQPIAILNRRMILRKRRLVEQVLIQWSQMSAEDSNWEDVTSLRQQFPAFSINP
ncbi:hypothetical protein AXF42_Ash021618 [Apostasia shenzhenica]|uniref:Integrase catalytic domain-containing protein n=1 Tax=Apostasia shenzhenica TaxID=1088818 RepID=A0A2H9ZYP0_9ASPA|nr:hypothetical protein AXF42_Ash021618 [Apostasia shenzhenica]